MKYHSPYFFVSFALRLINYPTEYKTLALSLFFEIIKILNKSKIYFHRKFMTIIYGYMLAVIICGNKITSWLDFAQLITSLIYQSPFLYHLLKKIYILIFLWNLYLFCLLILF